MAILVEPCLAHVEHVAIREHFKDFALDTLCLELVSASELPFAIGDMSADVEKGELWIDPKMPENLPKRELLI